MHPTGVDIAHAIQQNGVGGPGTVPTGRTGLVDPEHEASFRAGFLRTIDGCNSLAASYTQLFSHATDSLAAGQGVGQNVRSLVLHPGTVNAGSTSSLIEAEYDIDFQLVDAEFRQLLHGSPCHAINYWLGARYGMLEQRFLQVGSFAPPLGTIETTTEIEFHGAGVRAGLDGERRLGCSRLSLYGKGSGSLLVGEFQSSFSQVNLLTTVEQAASNFDEDRVVPIVECEVGVAWTGRRLRLTAGYSAAFWFNAITAPEYIQAVQAADFVNLGDTIAFSGLATRAEWRF